jgi:hypothetical protein
VDTEDTEVLCAVNLICTQALYPRPPHTPLCSGLRFVFLRVHRVLCGSSLETVDPGAEEFVARIVTS